MSLSTGPQRIPGRDLVDLLDDDEIAVLARSIFDAVDRGEVDTAAVRAVLDGWFTTARIRSHPDFSRNHEAFQRAVGGP